jgi:hypothetical protein
VLERIPVAEVRDSVSHAIEQELARD